MALPPTRVTAGGGLSMQTVTSRRKTRQCMERRTVPERNAAVCILPNKQLPEQAQLSLSGAQLAPPLSCRAR